MKRYLFIIIFMFCLNIFAQSCQDCHKVEFNLFSKTAHSDLNCDICHIGYEEHIAYPDKSNAKAVNSNICSNCHKTLKVPKGHQKSLMDCLSCHLLNHSKNIVKKNDCRDCHLKEFEESKLPFNHRLECKECHNPHKELKNTPSICKSCHIDKKGPFVYEHMPIRAGQCTFCHFAHGSPNKNLLLRANLSFLCLECHLDISSFHNPSEPVYQNCILCHSEIHGSNKNKNFID